MNDVRTETTPGLTKSLRRPGESWRIAFLGAVGTLAAIVAAFALDAAWNQRTTRISERAYLDALASEVDVTQATLRENRAFVHQRIGYIDHYLRTVALARPGTMNVDTIYAMISVLGPPVEFVPQRAALDDLEAGGLDLVRSDSLRRAIAAYDQALERDAVIQSAGTELWRTQLSPYDVEHAHLAVMGRGDSGSAGRDAGFEPDASAYHGNRTYSNLLFSRYNFEGRTLEAHDILLARMSELVELLRNGR